MKKRILCLLLCCAMLVGLIPTAAFAEGTSGGKVLTQELIEEKKDKNAKSIVLPAGDYYLAENVYLVDDDADSNSAWPLVIEGDATLDLNGYVLDLRGACIVLSGKLTLTDSNTKSFSHKFRMEESGLWVLDENGDKTVTGGVITGGHNEVGGGVFVNGGRFTMAGGSIVGCTATDSGGGVFVNGGRFTMAGGSIVGCTATDGGGVFVQHSDSFTMSGGSIEDCSATQSGGGVFVQHSGSFNMSGGRIEDCTVTGSGGGVYNNGSFNMSGGRIEDCTATGSGGGVFVDKQVGSRVGKFKMEGGTISGCKVGDADNAVHADGIFNNNTNINKNHSDLKHFPAKAATRTAEGNIEYWHCAGCGKYYRDATATQEIPKADTITAKLPDDAKSPQMGDSSNLVIWITLLFVSVGGMVTSTTIVSRKRKHNR